MKTWFAKIGVEELERPAQSPDLNVFQNLVKSFTSTAECSNTEQTAKWKRSLEGHVQKEHMVVMVRSAETSDYIVQFCDSLL